MSNRNYIYIKRIVVNSNLNRKKFVYNKNLFNTSNNSIKKEKLLKYNNFINRKLHSRPFNITKNGKVGVNSNGSNYSNSGINSGINSGGGNGGKPNWLLIFLTASSVYYTNYLNSNKKGK